MGKQRIKDLIRDEDRQRRAKRREERVVGRRMPRYEIVKVCEWSRAPKWGVKIGTVWMRY